MSDPAAMGTLLIGLNAVRADAQDDHRPRRAVSARQRDHVGLRVALARALRRAAAMLDRPTVGEVTNWM
jgi:hypothetical protein